MQKVSFTFRTRDSADTCISHFILETNASSFAAINQIAGEQLSRVMSNCVGTVYEGRAIYCEWRKVY